MMPIRSEEFALRVFEIAQLLFSDFRAE